MVIVGLEVERSECGADFVSYSSSFATIRQTVIIAKRLMLDNKAAAVQLNAAAQMKQGFLCVCPPIDVPVSELSAVI